HMPRMLFDSANPPRLRWANAQNEATETAVGRTRKTKPPIAHRLQTAARARVAARGRTTCHREEACPRGISGFSVALDPEIPRVASTHLGMTRCAAAKPSHRSGESATALGENE